MTTMFVETSGTVHADGSLELDEKVTVPPGKVKVRVESIEAGSSAGNSPLSDKPGAEDLHLRNVEIRFGELVRQWKEATLLMSSITEMATQPAYQQIIGMGHAALPLIFTELRRNPDQWFWALKA